VLEDLRELHDLEWQTNGEVHYCKAFKPLIKSIKTIHGKASRSEPHSPINGPRQQAENKTELAGLTVQFLLQVVTHSDEMRQHFKQPLY
jgi:hypothetical protein